MKIRKAEKKDIPRILVLLGQVLQIHSEIRPDIFIPGTTKYTSCELTELLEKEDHPIYVAADEDDPFFFQVVFLQFCHFFQKLCHRICFHVDCFIIV